ncbi:AMP-binding protein [Ovoidimarina sediminis]|uniref:AMP-binding protein n=1 Tax=Ovoidimarina sediminis TaxID=3079856 RepID=UPI002914A6C8|nr:AMP-binding protein [Rhodophyticola sp. MJ-SS7]MDU8945902.1 AMP-binding protein [Rhodophyticola sp. MJ-SS7]
MTIVKSRFDPVSPTSLSVTERLFQGLQRDPDRTVLTDGPTGRTMTASDLETGIRRLASGLLARGCGTGTVTALMAPNIPEYVIVFHGAAYAGGAITTVNPTYTADELHHQLRDSGATLLVTIPQFLETARVGIEGTGVTEIVVIGEAEGATPLATLLGEPLQNQIPVDLDEDVVALPYSSGTTGLPKGVMLTHRNLVMNIDQTLVAADVRSEDVTIAFLPFFHIYGLTVLMNLHLAHGASLVTMPRFDLELFLELVQTHRPRSLYCVPPVAIALAKHPVVDQFDLSSVEIFFSAAAPLGAELGEAVATRLGCCSMQGYGMTELSPVSHLVHRDAPRPGSCGQTIPNTECRIVNPETGEICGTGEQGELWVRGPQVMKGYLNNPEATAATITPDGWLRTGDLASFDADGYLFIHDRLKELIKVKGFQVAPAELEAVLLTHPDVADAAVIGVPDEEAGERPAAFVVAKPGTEPSEEALKAHVAEKLSSYKALSEVRFIDTIPKAASGKILRRVLRAQA